MCCVEIQPARVRPHPPTTGFLHESNVKSLGVVRLSACLQDAALFRNSLPGFTFEAAAQRLHHRSGANQLRNFIAHSNPRKQAWKTQEPTLAYGYVDRVFTPSVKWGAKDDSPRLQGTLAA